LTAYPFPLFRTVCSVVPHLSPKRRFRRPLPQNFRFSCELIPTFPPSFPPLSVLGVIFPCRTPFDERPPLRCPHRRHSSSVHYPFPLLGILFAPLDRLGTPTPCPFLIRERLRVFPCLPFLLPFFPSPSCPPPHTPRVFF